MKLPRRPFAPLLAPALAGLILLPLAGCYERVVSASGPGADQAEISKANLPKESQKGSMAPRSIEHSPLRSRN